MKNSNKARMARALDAELRNLRVSDELTRRILDAPGKSAQVIDFPGAKPAKRRPRFSALAAAACVAVMLLAATAVAAVNHWGVFDFLSDDVTHLTVGDGAKELVQTNLGQARSGDVAFTLRELLYDGKGLYFTLYAEPAEEGGWLASDEIDYDEEALAKTGDPRVVLELYADAESEQAALLEQRVDVKQDGRGIVFFYQGIVKGDDGIAPDSLTGEVIYSHDSAYTNQAYSVSIPFEAQARPSVQLTLAPETPFEALAIEDISLTHNDVADYVKITYHSAFDASEGTPFAIDDGATYYMTEHGTFFHGQSDCSGMANATAVTGAQIRESDKRPCPVCLDAQPPKSGFTGYGWRFSLLDDSGAPIEDFAYDTYCAEDRETYTTDFIVQRQAVKESYTLRAERREWTDYDAQKRAYTNENVATYDIPCAARPAGQD